MSSLLPQGPICASQMRRSRRRSGTRRMPPQQTEEGMETTVIQHVLSRLHDIRIKDVFGVAGDFAFPINDAVSSNRNLRWIGCCNELNAAYAADGYARTHGVAALCTTYGVGELSAICGVGGAYAEHGTVFHLLGMPQSGG